MSAERVLAGRYRLDRQIGRGGMGQVWSAMDTRLQRRVAVKTVDLIASSDGVAAERFQQEAHATAALSHPSIVTIFDNGVDGDTAYLVMELLSGPSLEELVRDEGPLPVDRALEYAQAVASALGAAHRAGVVHRDVKPSNLMLDDRGTLKIVDFGIARLDQERTSQLTATATVIGSAPYLSPEQATGSTATPQSDLYSLGCVLMTLLTGEPPFEGEHPLSVLHHHLSTPPPRPSDRRPGIPRAVDDLVAQLLAKRPEDRPASASDVARAIAEIRRGSASATTVLPAAGAVATATRPVDETGAAVRPRQTGATTATGTGAVRDEGAGAPAPRRRRGAGALWILVLLLAAAVAVLGWFATHRGSTTPGPATTTTVSASPTGTTTSTPVESSSGSTSQSTRTSEPTSTSTAPTTSEPTSTTSTATRTATGTATSVPTATRTATSVPTGETTRQAPTSEATRTEASGGTTATEATGGSAQGVHAASGHAAAGPEAAQGRADGQAPAQGAADTRS